ncbi:type I polyketide synthase [[Pseudopropionibacterium] massiliense]|uniref:type I polyketide synthase n=1 Tax=[Pseudopropionibacterium] massiliense TaxID=2220000 RepID=UPI001030D0AA|nr:type I polyketide synthase [[Pseudopropionibacterium] massiliense]
MTDEYDAANSWIAIVGMAGRFPGAPDLDSYWDLLVGGRDACVDLDTSVLAKSGVPHAVISDPQYVKRALRLDGVDEFDDGLFGFTPAAATLMDPQQRLFLQTVHHALEDAALDPWAVSARTGVFAATGTSTYLLNALMSGSPYDSMAYGANMQAVSLALSNDKDYIATRVSHTLNLTGPGISIQTACSSALVALHLACQSLLVGDCDIAVAGGVSVRVPQDVGYFAEPGSIMSPTGRCRPFDAAADGTIFGSGVGAVILKPYLAALTDGDPIRAIIRGSAINNDGNLKMGFSAPSVEQQAQVVADALAIAGVAPSQVGFIEGHGTGTPIGDPVEVQALTEWFTGSITTPCYLGSVKGNVGHLEAAAGMASLIKTVLALEYGIIPGTCHYDSPNPEFRLDGTRITITSESTEWDTPTRIAGVTSLGVGGTNVHVVLQSTTPPNPKASHDGITTLRLSAASPEALTRSRLALANHLAAKQPSLAAVESTLVRRNRTHLYRCTVSARTVEDATALLHGGTVQQRTALTENDCYDLVFLYTGQGSQFPGMGIPLAKAEPDFDGPLQEALTSLSKVSDTDFGALLTGRKRVNSTDLAQPLLFAVQYAWTKALETRGLTPNVVLGHSIGEFAAAVAAGIMDLDTASFLVCERGRLMAACPTGTMISFHGVAEMVIDAARTENVDVAAINSPIDVVLAGSDRKLERITNSLSSAGITGRRLITSHAFHSAAMDPVVPRFTDLMATTTLRAPQIPMASNITGSWLTASEAADPQRWGNHIRRTVQFADDVDLVLSRGPAILVEVGPGRSLISAARSSVSWDESRHHTVLTLGPESAPQDGMNLARCLGDLWASGLQIDDPTRATAQAVHLPGYPFERTRHWAKTNHRVIPAADSLSTSPDVASSRQQGPRSFGVTELLIDLIEQTLGVTGVTAEDDFYALGGDSVVAIRLAAEMTQQGWPLNPEDVLEAESIGDLAARLGKDLIDPEMDENGNVIVDLVPTQLRLVHEGGLPWHAWRIPLLLQSRTRLDSSTIERAFSILLERHDILRLTIDATTLPVSGRLVAERQMPITFHGTGTLDDAESILGSAITNATEDEPLVQVHVWDDGGSGTLLGIIVPHAFVDATSQHLIVDELSRLLGGSDDLPPTSSTWAEWTRVASQLSRNPLVTQNQLPAPGVPKGPGAPKGMSRRRRYERLTSTMEPALTADLLTAQQTNRVPLETILAEALGEALVHRLPGSVPVFEMAGTMRSVRLKGVDLSRSVGWFTTVFPVAWLKEQGIETPLHQGFGYDAARLSHVRRPESSGHGGILLYYRAIQPPPDDAPLQVIRSHRLEAITQPGLGHDIQLEVTREGGKLEIAWWRDVEQVGNADLEELANDFMETLRAWSAKSDVPDDLRNALAQELGL